jgi:hypothetical protein
MATEDCAQCNVDLLNFKLNDVADKLIGHCRQARLIAPAQNQDGPGVSLVPPLPATGSGNPWTFGWPGQKKSEKGYFAQLSMTRKVLASVLGGLAGAALISSIALTVTNGHDTPLGCDKRTDVLQDKCILNNTPLMATGYVLTGALVAGIGFTLFWPKKPSRPVAREVR